MINPVCLLLADALAAVVTWRKLYMHRGRGMLARTSFTSVLLCDGTQRDFALCDITVRALIAQPSGFIYFV